MNCEIPLLDPREPRVTPACTVRITEVTPQFMVIEVEEEDGTFSVQRIPRKQIGSA